MNNVERDPESTLVHLALATPMVAELSYTMVGNIIPPHPSDCPHHFSMEQNMM